MNDTPKKPDSGAENATEKGRKRELGKRDTTNKKADDETDKKRSKMGSGDASSSAAALIGQNKTNRLGQGEPLHADSMLGPYRTRSGTVFGRVCSINSSITQPRGNSSSSSIAQPRGSTSTKSFPDMKLMKEMLETQDLIFCTEETVCPCCFASLEKGEGILLRECAHTFCRNCLVEAIQETEGVDVRCPYMCEYACEAILPQREIKGILSPKQFEDYLAKSLRLGESNNSSVAGNMNYHDMMICIENQDLFPSIEDTECPVCLSMVCKGDGVTLRECFHTFCKECISSCIQYCEHATVKCPYRGDDFQCECVITDREVKALVSKEIFEKYLDRSLKIAEGECSSSFHCRTPDCAGWCEFEDGVNTFHCPVCKKTNCINCRAVHEGKDCRKYQLELDMAASTDPRAKKTQELLKQLIKDGKAMHCPKCNIVLQKISGCDGMQCTYCKTHICWVTKGPRWGPKGPGDVSGGCGCKVNGKRCHPNCGNCH